MKKKATWRNAFRRLWKMKPITKVVVSKKLYKRKTKHGEKNDSE